ncbi:hypothetical protein, partial [Klebsiella pneumoniae]|uniref:hypothetical protein n=1 Tax=Klebsiella pneumoniae TaxID=573 RepID=UPI0013A57B7E
MLIDTGNSTRDGLSAVAVGDINITEDSGDLRLTRVHTSEIADVWLTIPGDLLDSNTLSQRDTRTEAQLLALYEDMRLTGRAADRGIVE